MNKEIIAINKPKGMTSHDVIDVLRKQTGVRTIGHAGTLDPLAHGVLVVGIGKSATKMLAGVVKKEKEYVARVRLGMESETDDEEGAKREWQVNALPDRSAIEAVLESFVGVIAQVPPAYSAIKMKGKKAYELARSGKTPDMQPRRVEIKSIDALEYEWPFVTLKVVTGPGVYIRALARDLGTKLGTGGYLADLERTRVGEFTIESARSL